MGSPEGNEKKPIPDDYLSGQDFHKDELNEKDKRYTKVRSAYVKIIGVDDKSLQDTIAFIGSPHIHFSVISLYIEKMGDLTWFLSITVLGAFNQFKKMIKEESRCELLKESRATFFRDTVFQEH